MTDERVRHLLALQLGGMLTEKERQELNEILQNPDLESLVKEELGRCLLDSDPIPEARGTMPETQGSMPRAEGSMPEAEEEWEPVLQEIFLMDKTAAPKTDRGRVLRLPSRIIRWTAAAALLLGFAGGTTWYYLHRQQPQPATDLSSKAIDPIIPGSNKAILTLANGQQIILNNAQKGLLSQQGAVQVIKLDSGQLAYRTAGASGSSVTPGSPGDAANAGAGVNAAILYNTVFTPRGGQYQITLPDGTRVWLNSESSLRFPTAFTGKDRVVLLKGEAYFEAAPDKDKPFIVSTGTVSTRVLGTHFNIMAYDDEDAIRTTLLEGAVNVEEGSQSALLAPGEQAQLDYTNHTLVRRTVNTRAVTAWKDGYYFFDRTPVSAVMRQIARWYDVDIDYTGSVPKDEIVGKIPRTAHVSEVLHIMELIGIRFRVEGRKITVLGQDGTNR